MTGRFYLGILFMCIIAGCQQTPQQAAPPATPVKKPDYVAPFHFHKLIEVSPGQDYDILSWGRGSATSGSFLILHSDSASKKYTTTTGDIDGTIVDVYNSDMDLDGNPEILIQARGTDSTNYANIYAFEFNSAGKAQKLDFPKLNRSQRKGYKGEDNFYIKEGKFMREFPIYDGTHKDAKPTGAKRVLEYGLRDNSFTVKQLSKDSTDNTSAVTAQQPAKSVSTKPSSGKKEKKHTAEKKHKKKKHHHRSE